MLTAIDITTLARAIATEIKPAEGRWIRGLRAASQYAKINRDRLTALLDAGVIRGYQTEDTGKPTWIVDRESIDQYHNDRIEPGDDDLIDKKVVAFLGKGSNAL